MSTGHATQPSQLCPTLPNAQTPHMTVRDQLEPGVVKLCSHAPCPDEATIIDARYHIPRANLTQFDIDRVKNELSFDIADFGYGGPTQLNAYEITSTHLIVPKFYGRRRFGAAQVDRQTAGEPQSLEFVGELRGVQQEALSSLICEMRKHPDTGGALAVLPCGFGKTILALAVAAELKVATLVLVTKGFLADQWETEVHRFLPSATLGRLQRNVADRADICIGMVQSLMAREYPHEVMQHYGLVICDECHHMAARAFMRSLWSCPAKYILGLSATPERRDGTTPLLHHMLGEVGFKCGRLAKDEPVTIAIVQTKTRHPVLMRKGTPTVDMAKMLSRLIEDEPRNALITEQLVRYMHEGRNILLLSDRVQHLKTLETLVKRAYGDNPPPMGFYTGATKRADRQWAEVNAQLILSTFHMTKEGFNVPRLDTVVFATPKSSDVEQCIGRIQRPSADKMCPLVVDILDCMPVFEAMGIKRINFYRSNGYGMTRESGANKRARADAPPPNLSTLIEGTHRDV